MKYLSRYIRSYVVVEDLSTRQFCIVSFQAPDLELTELCSRLNAVDDNLNDLLVKRFEIILFYI